MDITLQEIADIVDDSRGRNYFSNQLQNALKPLFKKLEGIEKSKEEVSLMNLFKLDENKSKALTMSYEKAMKSFIAGFEDKVKEFRSGSIMDVITGSSTKPKTDTKSPPPLPNVANKALSSVSKKKDIIPEKEDLIQKVSLESVSESLMGLFSNNSGGDTNVGVASNTNNSSGDKNGGSLIGKILKGLALGGLAVGLLAGGMKAGLSGLLNDTPFRGLLKIISVSLLKAGSKIFTKFFDNVSMIFKPLASMLGGSIGKQVKTTLGKIPMPKFLTKLLGIGKFAGKGLKFAFKAIPFLGSIISLVFAFKRFKEGDFLGGLLELGAAIPVVGIAFSVVSMLRDMTMTSDQKKEQGGSFLQGLKNWFMDLKVVKAIVNLFSGFKLLFTAKSGSDIDNALAHFERARGLLWVIPMVGPMLEVITFIQNSGGVLKAGKKLLKGYGRIFVAVWSKIGNLLKSFVNILWDWWSNLINAIWESDFMRKIKLNISLKFNEVQLAFGMLFNALSDALNFVSDKAQKLGKGVVDVIIPNALQTQSIKKWINSESAKIPDFDEAGMRAKMKQKTNELSMIDKRAEERKAKIIKQEGIEREQRDRKYQDLKHKEMLAKMDETSGNQIAASQASASAIVKSNLQRESGNITNLFSNIGAKTNEDLRKDAFNFIY